MSFLNSGFLKLAWIVLFQCGVWCSSLDVPLHLVFFYLVPSQSVKAKTNVLSFKL